MSSKILTSFLGGCLTLFFVMGITTYKAEAQVSAAGKTDTPATQIIAPVIEDDVTASENASGLLVDRHTHVTITNTGNEAVTVHVQFLISKAVGCSEVDFFDTFTAQDTHLYSMDSFCTTNDDVGGCPISIGNRDGLFVVTPVVSVEDPVAKAFNHLHGVVHIFNGRFDGDTGDPLACGGDEEPDCMDTAYRFNAVGRSAVDLTTGGLLADNTVLDGGANGLEDIIPDAIMYQYFSDTSLAGPSHSDVILVAISDTYGAVSGYKAEAGTASYEAFRVCNDDEICISCDTKPIDCIDIYGINDTLPPLHSADPVICDEAGDPEIGLDQLLLSSASANAVFGIIGVTTSNIGGAAHTFVE